MCHAKKTERYGRIWAAISIDSLHFVNNFGDKDCSCGGLSKNQPAVLSVAPVAIAILFPFRVRLEPILMSIHPVADDPIGFLRLVPEEAVTAAVDDFHLGAFDVVPQMFGRDHMVAGVGVDFVLAADDTQGRRVHF